LANERRRAFARVQLGLECLLGFGPPLATATPTGASPLNVRGSGNPAGLKRAFLFHYYRKA
jgi:hypothetical protein